VRALLYLVRANDAVVQGFAAPCAQLLKFASQCLTVLSPSVGDEELRKELVAALAKLRML